MKYLFLDVETTGIEATRCAIIQLSGIIEVNGVFKESFDYKIKPHRNAEINKEALAVSGVTEEEIMTFPEPFVVFKEFITVLEKYVSPYDKKDKFFFIAYNAMFDFEFIRAFFFRNQNNFFSSYFWHPYIDVMTLAIQALKEKRPFMPNFKLLSVAGVLNIPLDEEKLHNALYDIEITQIVYNKVTNTQNNPVSINPPLLPKEETLSITTENEKPTLAPKPSIDTQKEFFEGLF